MNVSEENLVLISPPTQQKIKENKREDGGEKNYNPNNAFFAMLFSHCVARWHEKLREEFFIFRSRSRFSGREFRSIPAHTYKYRR